MWVRKKEWDTLKEKVAALEEEQLQLRKRIKENLVFMSGRLKSVIIYFVYSFIWKIEKLNYLQQMKVG